MNTGKLSTELAIENGKEAIKKISELSRAGEKISVSESVKTCGIINDLVFRLSWMDSCIENAIKLIDGNKAASAHYILKTLREDREYTMRDKIYEEASLEGNDGGDNDE